MHASKWKKKPPEALKKIKTVSSILEINSPWVSIKWGKVLLLFCKKLFSCINYLQ